MSSFPQRDMAQLWRICAVFFWGFPFLCLLTPGVEPHAERYGATVAHLRRIFLGFFPFFAC